MALAQVKGMNVAQVIEFYGTDPRDPSSHLSEVS